MVTETLSSPLESAQALAAQCYLGDAMLGLDEDAIFARSWQLVARSDQLEGAGDHVVERIGRVPVLIVRGQDGELRAFPNVCRHRAGPLALCDGKGAKALHCKYHGWTYGLDGQLRSAPEMGDALDFDVGSIRLPPLHVREWQGLVFVALGDATTPFEELIEGIAERIAPIDLAAMRFRRRQSYGIACNWKVYVDNFLEGYHLPHVHPGLSRLLDYRAYRTELAPWKSLQTSPLRDAGNVYGSGDAWYYHLYPNTMLNILPGRLQTNRVVATGAQTCRVDFDFYYSADAASQARSEGDESFSDEVQIEDVGICEAVQIGLASGHYEAGRLNPKRESGVWHFHNQLRAAYAAAAAEDASR